MAPDKKHLEDVAQFIHEHRSNESHFQVLYDRLLDEYKAAQENESSGNSYAEALRETIEKHAATYKQNKEKGISTWAEFENVINHFERSVTGALHNA